VPDFEDLFESWLQSTDPAPDKIDYFFKRVFEQPVESVDWIIVLKKCQERGHPDLPELYRRMNTVLSAAQSQRLGQFQNTAAEVLRLDHPEMYDEVLAATMSLDPAITPMEELEGIVRWAVACDRTEDCERLQERFAEFPQFLLPRSEKEERFDGEGADIVEDEEPQFPPEVEEQLDSAWSNYNAIKKPTHSDAEALVEALLRLPHEATSWIEPFDELRATEHPDIYSLFAQIVSTVGSSGGSDLSFMAWGAMEEACKRGESERLLEISRPLHGLDATLFDTDAVFHIAEYLLACNFVDECLKLKEYHYPTLSENDDILGWVAPETAEEIFTIRLGIMIASSGLHGRDASDILAELSEGLEEELNKELNGKLIRRLLGSGDDAKAQEKLEMPLSGTPIDEAQSNWVAVHATFVQVAKHAGETTDEHPAKILIGLQLVEDSASSWIAKRCEKKRKQSRNLFDCLDPQHIEQQVAAGSQSFMGINEQRARTMLTAYRGLVHWADQQSIPLPADSSKIIQKIDTLQKKIGG